MLWSFSSRDVSSNVVRTIHNFDNLYFHYQGGLIMKRNGHKKLREKLLYLYQHVRDHHWWSNIEKAILCIYLPGPEKKKENLTLTKRYLLCLNLRYDKLFEGFWQTWIFSVAQFCSWREQKAWQKKAARV